MILESVHEECGVFGIFDKPDSDVAVSTYYALYALQHRGQESCGIAVNDDGVLSVQKDLGLVHEVFSTDRLKRLGRGSMAIGHVRASTTGNPPQISNAQPLLARHINGPMAIAHNGSLTNSAELRRLFELNGAIFHSNSDVEVITYLITRARLTAPSIEEAIEAAMYELGGAYSLVIMSAQKLIAVRDPEGFRPLCMGKRGDAIIFASESCALTSLGAEFVRDIEPGEIVVVSSEGITSIKTHCKSRGHSCIFEFVYLARPDSVVDGTSVHVARKRAGKFLAQEHPVEADVVIGAPDSGLDAALGYSQESGIPYGIGFIKNRYVGRTFIQPTQGEREDAVRIKLQALASTVAGKRVILVDDSIVRGTTCKQIIHLLREAGATEVHMRVASPPFMNPCYFGTDVDSRDKLIACRMTVDEIAKSIDVDSLGYLSLEGIKGCVADASCDFCVGCFTGVYPVATPEAKPSNKFERKLSERDKV